MTRSNQNSTSSCMAQKDQRGRIKSELNEHGHSGRVLAPVIGRYGVASSDLSPILDLVAREMARKRTAPYNLQHWLFGSRSHVQTEACTQMGSRNRSEMGLRDFLDRLRDFVLVPSSAGGNPSFKLHSQSTEERATSDRYHHFHDYLDMRA